MKALIALALCVAASPALADAVTYQGTIGDEPIFVEFSETPHAGNAEIFGRYFYADKGVDIPLHAAPAVRSRFGLFEEVPCKAEGTNCPHAQDDPPTEPPLGAKWQLEVSDDGVDITGEWSSNGRNHPVSLERIGSRAFDPADGLQGFSSFATGLFYEGTVLTLETSPYDYAKMALFALDRGEAIETAGGRYRYVTDVRTKFQFPRIVDLASGADPKPANAALEQRHWAMSLDALWCVAQQYQGFGWNGNNFDAGTLGWWDEEQIEVHYLSPTILSWTEGGSQSCGYAHPNNHYEFYNLDVASGQPLDLSLIFSGWIAKTFDGEIADLDEARADPSKFDWVPDEKLASFVKSHRPTDEELGFSADNEDCMIDELIDSNLAIGFKANDVVLFSLDGLPYAIQACGSDLFEAPIADLAELLTPEAADYFPVLGH